MVAVVAKYKKAGIHRSMIAPEKAEQKLLTIYLNHRFGEWGWLHIPNEQISGTSPSRLAALMYAGMKPGAPDNLIFVRVPTIPACRGVALELKKLDGKESAKQHKWGEELIKNHWIYFVAYGAQDAINKIESVYGKIGKSDRRYDYQRKGTIE